METFIATRIEEARAISVEKGKAKYRTYFVKIKIYKKWQSLVDAILETDDCADVIVPE